MSLQQGLNQLLGGASALLSLNPQVQAGGAEQGELRKLNRQEKGFQKQVESATPLLAENKAKLEVRNAESSVPDCLLYIALLHII